MKAIGLYLIVLLSLGFYTTVAAQGGDNAANALSAPINIPFTSTGTTTGTNNDYDYIPAYWSIFTAGGDWLYYFCAGSTDQILVDLGVTPPGNGRIFPSITVWQGGAPGVGTLVEVVDSDGETGSVALSFQAIAGTCYYVMIDSYDGEVPSFDYTITIQYQPDPILQPGCSNMGYDDGTVSGWLMSYGYTVTEGGAGDPLPRFTPNVYNTPSVQHVITNAGNDPLGGFPKVCNLLPGNTNSLQLGDGEASGQGGARIEQKFSVTNSNALFTYFYAVVVQDAGVDHPNTAQPFFMVELLDCQGDTISCGQYIVTGGPNIPGFFPVSNPNTNNVYYSPWKASFIDLSPYIGSCVTVRFTVADCSRGAHYGYAYVDAICAPIPVITPDTICLGQSVQLSSPILGNAYQWKVQGTQTVIGTGQSLNASPTVNTIYECLITNASGCTTTLSFPVVVLPQVTAVIQADTVCQGQTGTLICTVNPAGGSYQWSGGLGNQSSIAQSPLATTSYTCTYVANGCTVTATAAIVVNPLPVAPVTIPVTYCQNATPSSLLNSVTALQGHSLNWYGTNANGGVAFPTPPLVNTSVVTTIIYYVSQTNMLTGCEGPRAPIVVTINPLPALQVNSPTTCSGVPVQLTASGADSYSWSTLETGPSITVAPTLSTTYIVTGTNALNGCTNTVVSLVTISGTIDMTINAPIICQGESAILTVSGANDYVWSTTETGASITVTPAVSTVYTVEGTLGGCTSEITTVVTVNPIPQVSVNSPLICAGSSATLSTFSSPPGGSYDWLENNETTPFTFVTPNFTSDYHVVYSLNGCTDTAIAHVVVNQIPEVTIQPDTICVGSEALLQAFVTESGGEYSWNPGGNTTSEIMVSPVGEIQYIVNYTINGCSASDTAIALVNQLPEIDAGQDVVVCEGESVILTATGGVNYQWNGAVQNGQPFVPLVTQVYTVAGFSTEGCSAQDSVLVTVAPLPVVDFVPDDTLGCAPLEVTFTNQGQGSVDCYWTISNGYSQSGCGALNYTFEEPGCYDISLTVADQYGCTASLTANDMVCVEGLPIASFTADPTLMPNYSTTSTMSNTSVNADSYVWIFENVGNSTEVNPVVTFPETEANYDITLIAYTEFGCTDTARATVGVYEEVIFYVPNTFTPDDDEFNQVFMPVFTSGFDPYNFTLFIFDRWGELIFESHDASFGWDGTYQGKIVQDGTYVWKINYQKKNGSGKKSIVGHINLLK